MGRRREKEVGRTNVGEFIMVIPQHRAALCAEAALARTHLVRFIVLVEAERGDVHPARRPPSA